MTRPELAFPEKTKPALRTWKTARPVMRWRSNWGETGINIRRNGSRDTSCTLENDLGNRVESRFRVVGISFGKDSGCVSGCIQVGGVGNKPRKDARILAAFSASPSTAQEDTALHCSHQSPTIPRRKRDAPQQRRSTPPMTYKSTYWMLEYSYLWMQRVFLC
jgi:hypothetical protein